MKKDSECRFDPNEDTDREGEILLPAVVEPLKPDAVLKGKGPAVSLDDAVGGPFVAVTTPAPFSRLVICRPFLPGKTDAYDFHYYFVNSGALSGVLDKVSIAAAAQNHSHTFVENCIYRQDPDFFQSLQTICIAGGDYVETAMGSDGDTPAPRAAFLVSSDTHAAFMGGIADHFDQVCYIIPKLTRKDDGAAAALEKMNLEYIELDYNDRECPPLEAFAPDFIFCGADWTSEFFAAAVIAEKLSVPVIALQEGPQDWNMNLFQTIGGKKVLRMLNHYRNADIFLAQGAETLKYIRPRYVAVTGNPKIGRITEHPLPPKPVVLINCNFTYVGTKPPYENNRDMWLKDVVAVCGELKMDYFISQHPRDDGQLDYPNVVPSRAAVIGEQLLRCSVVVSRFSSIPYEALAHGRGAVYYNPHREPMLSYSGDLHGAVRLAANPQELKRALAQHKANMAFDREGAAAYLARHCGPMDGGATDRIIDLFNALPNRRFRHDRLMADVANHAHYFHFAQSPPRPTGPKPGQEIENEIENETGKRTIAVFARNSATEYSGGRYYSFMLAEGLSYAGHKVFYITENLPVFYGDFGTIPTHQDIEVCLTPDFLQNLPRHAVDVVIVVPGLDRYHDYYTRAIAFAGQNRAHLVLLNFESPNWFNEMSPFQRDPQLWDNWERVARYSSLILSSTAEGRKYAREYYRRIPATAVFDYAYPPMNTFTAAKVVSKNLPVDKRILMLVRFFLSNHKGCFNIPDFMSEAMGGYTLVLLVGAGTVPADTLREIREKAEQLDIRLELKYKLSDYEKYMEMQKASLLLFPSFFEGYGYPPVEALYFNTPCIAFDLPVLRETCKDSLVLVPRGDWTAFKTRIADVLRGDVPPQDPGKIRENITDAADFNGFAEKIDAIITTLTRQPPPGELQQCRYVPPGRMAKRTVPPPSRPSSPPGADQGAGDQDKPGHFSARAARWLRKYLPAHRVERLKRLYHRLRPGKKWKN